MLYKLAVKLQDLDRIIELNKEHIKSYKDLLEEIKNNTGLYNFVKHRYKDGYYYIPDYLDFYNKLIKTDKNDLENLMYDVNLLGSTLKSMYQTDKSLRDKVIYDIEDMYNIWKFKDGVLSSKFKEIPKLEQELLAKVPKYWKYNNLINSIKQTGFNAIEQDWYHKFNLVHDILERIHTHKSKLTPRITSHIGSDILTTEYNILSTMPDEAKRVRDLHLGFRELAGEYNKLDDVVMLHILNSGKRMPRLLRNHIRNRYNDKIFKAHGYEMPKTKAVHNMNMLLDISDVYPKGTLLDHIAAKMIVENPQKFNYRDLPFETKVQIKKLYQNYSTVQPWVDKLLEV